MYVYGIFLFFFLVAANAVAQVQIEASESQIAVHINGKLFTTLQKGKDANKPYLAPLLTASGKHVTRGFPMEKIAGEPTDHPHQRGVWMGAEHLSGMNIWENDPADPHPHMGTIEFRNVLETHDGPKSGGFTIAAQWINQDGQPIIDETLAVTFYAEPAESRTFDVDMRLKAIKLSTFEDGRDGVIGIRFAPAFAEDQGGRVVNAEGLQGSSKIEGAHSTWVDWQATLDGEKVGVAIMDNPGNRRAPTTWRAREFGLLFANPFAQRFYDKSRADGSLGLQPGDELRLRYRFLIHPAGTDIAAAFKDYCESGK
ncbi:MAG: PmoA family protein [Terracidiphilus sp.]|nr:PmoA family protein [Terracidiphilus sp.]